MGTCDKFSQLYSYKDIRLSYSYTQTCVCLMIVFKVYSIYADIQNAQVRKVLLITIESTFCK